MMNEKLINECIENIQSSEGETKIITDLSSALSVDINKITVSNINTLGKLITCVLTKYSKTPSICTEYRQWLLQIQKSGTNLLKSIASNSNKDFENQRRAAFKEFINQLPFYGYITQKLSFPITRYGAIVKIIILSDGGVPSLINILKEYMMFKDMFENLWLAVKSATDLNRPLSETEVKNTTLLLKLFGLSERELKDQQESFVKTSNVKLRFSKPKKVAINTCAKTIWERLVQTELSSRTQKRLLLTVIENLMPTMDKPIFLLDYFTKCFNQGGASSMIAIKGIFELVYKYNLDYPEIYENLYQMFNVNMFGTSYRSRFYILANTLLSSLYLPKILAASFIKRFARLCLVAPPYDIKILLDFIMNLLIRHPDLQKLIITEGVEHMDCDPFLEDESNPYNTRAIDSFLWELVLLQNHIIPLVADAANFIKFRIPKVERNFTPFLDFTLDQMFQKKIERKLTEPALTFEPPTQKYLSQDSYKQGFSLWDFTT